MGSPDYRSVFQRIGEGDIYVVFASTEEESYVICACETKEDAAELVLLANTAAREAEQHVLWSYEPTPMAKRERIKELVARRAISLGGLKTTEE